MRVLGKPNYYDVERAFLEALSDAGISPAPGEQIVLDSKRHYYSVCGDKKKKRGQYCVYYDEWPAGYFMKYGGSSAVPKTNWQYKTDFVSAFTPEERKAFYEEQKAKRLIREEQAEKDLAKVVLAARLDWKAATEASPEHPYAERKKLQSVPGARLYGVGKAASLVIAYCDTKYEIQTLQTISPKIGVNKLFTDGSRKRGHFCVLSGFKNPDGNGVDIIPPNTELTKDSPIFLCEGWATGVSIYEATGCTTVVGADAGNLAPVLSNLRNSYPDRNFVIAADNDSYKKGGNTGTYVALQLWKEYGTPVVAPDFEEGEERSDWNDFAQKHGLAITKRSIMSKLRAFKESEEFKKQEFIPRYPDINSETGRPLFTLENLQALLKAKQIYIAYNVIKKEEVMRIPGKIYTRDLAAEAGVAYVKSVCIRNGLPKSCVDDYISAIAAENEINPVKDFILSEPWDGINRLHNVFNSIHTDPESEFPEEFKRTLIRRWLLSGVAAAFSKGSGDFRCRGVLVFQGGQGIGKSTWFRTITGNHEWFGDGQSINPATKDDVMPAIRCWIVEFGELEGTFKKADMSKIKTFIAAAKDDLRVPYARHVTGFSRRTIFCATVNQREFLMDVTGSGRFWCIPAIKIDRLDPVEVQQIWAQVYEEYYLNHQKHPKDERYQWWLTDTEEKLLAKHNGEFEASDPVRSKILSNLNWEAFECLYTWKTSSEVLEIIGYPTQNITKSLAMEASRVLADITGKKAQRQGKHGDRKYFVPPVMLEGYSV